MKSHLRFNVELDWLYKFEDVEKLKFLNKSLTKDGKYFNTEDYKNFIEKFYNDYKFNKIYNIWLNNKDDKYLKPSLDHINPKANDCNLNDLNNLQFLTWFENRCKNDMNQNEWNKLKNNINSYLI